MSKHLVTMFCGYQQLAQSPNQRYCNRSCSGFHVSRRPRAKRNKIPPARNAVKIFVSSYDPVWLERGKRHVTKRGYVDLYFWSPQLKMQFSRREHIVIWSTVHGDEVPRGWCIHHIDEYPDNNSPDNLLALPWGMHQEIHRKLEQVARECHGLEYVVRRHKITKEYAGQVEEMLERERSWHGEGLLVKGELS